MRGDLGERLLPVELPRLGARRKTEAALDGRLERELPTILGGLFTLIAKVLANPVSVDRLPRMADAGKIMAAIDAQIPEARTLDAYRASQKVVTEQVLESDPLAAALERFVSKQSETAPWRGTPTQLFKNLAPYGVDVRNWPANPRGMSERVIRMAPALRSGRGSSFARGRGKNRELVIRWTPTELKRRRAAREAL